MCSGYIYVASGELSSEKEIGPAAFEPSISSFAA